MNGCISVARIEFKGLEEYEKKLFELGAKSEGICKRSIYDAAGMVADAVRNGTPVGIDERTKGDLQMGVVLTDMTNEDGFVSTTVTFEGYDSKGAPLRLVARALESGRSTSKGKVGKHPFFRKALNSVRKAAKASIEFELAKNIEKAMKG